MSRKRIALLCSQSDEKYQKEFIEGFLEEAFGKDYDVCIFSTFLKEPESHLKEIGETNIFNLINYDEFDAFVLIPDVLQVSGLMVQIEEKLKSFKGKVLYVDKPSDDYPYIMIDHYTPFLKLMDHLISDHGYKDIAFINGYKFHPHSSQRLNAYVDAYKKYNLDMDPERIFYGNYWFDSGQKIIQEMVSNKVKMPEAFICANDYMAIGVSEQLVKAGYKIPDDIAIVGYDLVEAGQKCPEKITSVELPTLEFGRYAAECIHNLIVGVENKEFVNNSPIVLGTSCGCHIKEKEVHSTSSDWNLYYDKTVSYFSSFNKLTEDLVLQISFKDFIDCVQTYSYQIREFESFTICLNDVWVKNVPIESTSIRKGYTEEVVPILHCGPSGKGADVVDFDARFKSEIMFPELYEECDHPRAFIFSPLSYDDITFGYGIISYGSIPKSYNDAYFRWMKSVTFGIECMRRKNYIIQEKKAAEEIQITDSLTGMFNYDGFVKHAKPMIDRSYSNNWYIYSLVVELENLYKINKSYGRKEGENAVAKLSEIIFQSAGEGTMCCKLSNDEFLIADISFDPVGHNMHTVRSIVSKKVEEFNNYASDYKLNIFFGDAIASVSNLSQMEDLINEAVSQKNGNKANALKVSNILQLSDEELKQAELVRRILNENLFFYNFQPIVSAKDGSIFAYEALMRSKTDTFVSPLDILKYAQHYDRLKDVERATFFNVLDYIENNINLFENKKIFINSIPGCQLDGSEATNLYERLKKRKGQVVIELTEQTEADDNALSEMKENYSNIGVETAVDDYGTGYSNIVNLLRYMPNYVKIDRMLLTNIQDSPQKQHFVKDIVHFAHENKFQVLAEGIETKEELATVVTLGVDLIQGYYTAKPQKEVVQSIDELISEQIKKFALEKELA